MKLARQSMGAPECEYKVILKEKIIKAPSSELWRVLTTREGLESFFAPRCEIELKPLGNFSIHFFPDQPPGLRGAEDLRVLTVIPGRLLSFTWDAPPRWPEIRAQRTYVVMELEAHGPTESKIKFSHLGWGEGTEWQEVYDYFQLAWNVVLDRLEMRFVEGPAQWSTPIES